MDAGTQEIVDVRKVVTEIKKKLGLNLEKKASNPRPGGVDAFPASA
jgi:hypothetical protein